MYYFIQLTCFRSCEKKVYANMEWSVFYIYKRLKLTQYKKENKQFH